jgi:hypothetical protein
VHTNRQRDVNVLAATGFDRVVSYDRAAEIQRCWQRMSVCVRGILGVGAELLVPTVRARQ